MADTRLFYLDDAQTWDLAYDPHQWIIRRCLKVKGMESPKGIWFVGDRRAALMKGVGRHGIKLSDAALSALQRLPDTFGQFIFDRAQET